MVMSSFLKIPKHSRVLLFIMALFLGGYCPQLWAAQYAVVSAEKALIYSDQKMTSAIGYLSKGKKIQVGEVPRNKAQVLPIIVSGKVAYIRINDISTETQEARSEELVAERFQRQVDTEYKSRLVFGYYNFLSKYTENDVSTDFNWHGISLKGEISKDSRIDVQIIVNYMMSKNDEIEFQATEFGLGLGLRLLDFRYLKLKLFVEGLSVPFASYKNGSNFRINSYGYTLGGGGILNIGMGRNWGIEGKLGLYRTSLFKFKVPDPFEDISPVFNGVRAGVGLYFNY